MAEFIVMPKMGLTMTKGLLTNWRKKEGDTVNKGDILFDVETDKITNKIEAKTSGVLRKILVDKDTVNILVPVAIIGTADEDISELLEQEAGTVEKAAPQKEEAQKQEAAPAQERKPGERVKISPRAKKTADELNVDFNLVTGTGPGGAITEDDIRKFAERHKTKVSPMAAVVAGQLGVDTDNIEKDTRIMKADVVKYKLDENLAKYADPQEYRLPMSNMRKIIAERMLESVQTSPSVSFNIRVDTTGMKQLREELKDTFKVSYTDILVKIVSQVLLEYPMLNSTIDGDEIITRNYVNMGVAVALLVPVVRYSNVKGLKDISKEIKDLGERAKTNNLMPDELSGGTFTISNLGMFGIESFTPIINQPEVAILGVNAINKEPVIINDEVVVKPMMNLSLTADHRVVDGAVAAEFLAKLKEYIEKPGLLLL
jgi:pyruvate dehydrogenase E2 component (dihydrolipoamide acetyltransferase)